MRNKGDLFMGINVLSLFDGCGMAFQALKNIGVEVNNYFACEIDKYAIQVSMKNHPEIIQLGDVKNINSNNLPKIDLLIGGSPCQGFSFAGKQLNFNDERSKLFFEYVRIKNEVNPKFFLLENVKMKKEYQDIISDYLFTDPIEINSSLLSAQSRPRIYWFNWKAKLPEDKKILLKDIVLANVDENLKHSESALNYMNRTVSDGRTHWDFGHHSDVMKNKSSTVVANFFKGVPYNVLKDYKYIRKFHPIECERLQTLPDNYTSGVSDTQRYKMLGNGFTVAVIEYILKQINL